MVPIRSLLVVTLALLLASGSSAAPFAEWLETTSPGGRPVRIWGEGDEFSAAFEAADGHAVLYDDARRCYVYAVKDAATGALLATDIAAGDETAGDREILSGIPLHLRDTSQAARDERMRRRAEDEETFGTMRRWREVKRLAQARREAAGRGSPDESGILRAPPSRPTLGTVVGLTLLIDFPVTNAAGVTTGTLSAKVHPNVTAAHLEDLVNGENCTRYSNASSVRKYFEDVSCGHLSYTNIVLGWFMAARPREYYDDPDITFGKRARELVTEVFEQMVAAPDYETRYLPLLRQVSVEHFNDGPFFKALNVWIAGAKSPTWSKGLWPHKSNLYTFHYEKMPVEVDGETVYFRPYQMSPVTASPSIGTFCHENGHMVCGFPDLYDYEDTKAGVGYFSLMCFTHSQNPLPYDAYLRTAAGWVTPKDLPTAPSAVSIANSLDDVWRYAHPSDDTQYYLIENRQKKGRNVSLPGSGILIWRCDEEGDNRYPSRQAGFSGAATNRLSNELSVEQADGLYEVEQKLNMGNASDLWHASNTNGVFSAAGMPCARWRDASAASLRLWSFSNIGDVMTFHCADTAVAPVADAAIAEAVDASPGIVFWHGLNDYAGNWFVTDGAAYGGGTCARSGARENISRVYSHSILHAGVIGPGTLFFRWKVESESSPTKNYDWLAFTHDATTETNLIDGIVGSWEEVTAEIPSGYHVLSWIYRKDFLTDAGEDCGWIDAVTWIRDTQPITTMVAVSNRFDASGWTGLAVGDGGHLLVGSGGAFIFNNSPYTDLSYSSQVMSVGAGGTFEIDGGEAAFTNFNGRVNVTGTEENPGVVRLSSGSLLLAARQHTTGNKYAGASEIVVGACGRYEQTGGTNDIVTFVNGSVPLMLKGGEIDVSGESLWRIWSGSYEDSPATIISPRWTSGTGTVRFRDDAVFDPYGRAADAVIWLQPAANGGTSIVEFHDRARFDSLRDSGWGAKLGSIYMGGKPGGTAVLRLYSDATHGAPWYRSASQPRTTAAYSITVGDGYGNASLEMTNGVFALGPVGLRVGSWMQAIASGTLPWAVTGAVHLACGTLVSDGSASLNPSWSKTALYGDHIGSSSGQASGVFCGRVTVDGGSYSNLHGHLLVGYGFGEGRWTQNGGTSFVGADPSYSGSATAGGAKYVFVASNNVFAIGCAGGNGRFTQTGGGIRSNLRVFVGGVAADEFTTYMDYRRAYGTWLSDYTSRGYGDRHNATGYLGVLGGTFTAVHSITVGQDGTGVLEIGPTGTLQAASLVLANNAYTAAGDPAATLKFTFGADGVGTATVTNLVVASGTALTVDVRRFAFASSVRHHPILRAAEIEGAFDAAHASILADTPTHRAQTRIERVAGGLDVVFSKGNAILIK